MCWRNAIVGWEWWVLSFSSLIAFQLIKKFPVFYDVYTYITVYKEPGSGYYLKHLKPIYTPTSYFFPNLF